MFGRGTTLAHAFVVSCLTVSCELGLIAKFQEPYVALANVKRWHLHYKHRLPSGHLVSVLRRQVLVAQGVMEDKHSALFCDLRLPERVRIMLYISGIFCSPDY